MSKKQHNVRTGWVQRWPTKNCSFMLSKSPRNVAELFSALRIQKPETRLHISYLFQLRFRATFYQWVLKIPDHSFFTPKQNEWWRFSWSLISLYWGQIFPGSFYRQQWEISCTWRVIQYSYLMWLLYTYQEESFSTTTETVQWDYPY